MSTSHISATVESRSGEIWSVLARKLGIRVLATNSSNCIKVDDFPVCARCTDVRAVVRYFSEVPVMSITSTSALGAPRAWSSVKVSVSACSLTSTAVLFCVARGEVHEAEANAEQVRHLGHLNGFSTRRNGEALAHWWCGLHICGVAASIARPVAKNVTARGTSVTSGHQESFAQLVAQAGCRWVLLVSFPSACPFKLDT